MQSNKHLNIKNKVFFLLFSFFLSSFIFFFRFYDFEICCDFFLLVLDIFFSLNYECCHKKLLNLLLNVKKCLKLTQKALKKIVLPQSQKKSIGQSPPQELEGIRDFSSPQGQPNQTYCTAGESLLTWCAGLCATAQAFHWNRQKK